MELGITAAQINACGPRTRLLPSKRAEEFNDGARLDQQLQVFGIVKAESFIACNRDDRPRGASAQAGNGGER
jgi:hypothetical protein